MYVPDVPTELSGDPAFMAKALIGFDTEGRVIVPPVDIDGLPDVGVVPSVV